MSTVETFEHEGIPVRIVYDEACESPRTSQTNLGTILHWHHNYDFGEMIGGNTEEALRRGGLKLLERYLRLTRGASCVLPLGLLDHSGLHMYVGGGAHWSDSAGWDSGTVGVIFDTTESRDETGAPLDSIPEQLTNEVKEYDMYLQGQCYGYIVARNTPEEDSCWGFIGSEIVEEAAKEAAEEAARDRADRISRERVYLLDTSAVWPSN